MNVTLKSVTHGVYNEASKMTYEENKKDILATSLERIKKSVEGNKFKTEEEKDRYESELNKKIKLGSKLSPSEMSYIQRTNPMMYMRIKRVQMQKDMLENQLKQCKSKKEVEETYSQAMSMIHEKDPDKQLVMSAYNNVTKEFKNTREYKCLPPDIRDERHEKFLKYDVKA